MRAHRSNDIFLVPQLLSSSWVVRRLRLCAKYASIVSERGKVVTLTERCWKNAKVTTFSVSVLKASVWECKSVGNTHVFLCMYVARANSPPIASSKCIRAPTKFPTHSWNAQVYAIRRIKSAVFRAPTFQLEFIRSSSCNDFYFPSNYHFHLSFPKSAGDSFLMQEGRDFYRSCVFSCKRAWQLTVFFVASFTTSLPHPRDALFWCCDSEMNNNNDEAIQSKFFFS